MRRNRAIVVCASALLLVPMLLGSGPAYAYSLLRCRDGSVRKSCCCQKGSDHAAPVPTIERSCCELQTVQVERLPADTRRGLDAPNPLAAPLLGALELPLVFDSVRPAPARETHPATGPPILLKTCTLLV